MEAIRKTTSVSMSIDTQATAGRAVDGYGDSQHDNKDDLLVRLEHATQEREAAEHAMQRSEMRYRRLFEASNDSIILIDGHSLAVLNANQAAERLLGLQKHEFLGRILPTLHPFSTITDINRRLYELATQMASHQEITLTTAGPTGPAIQHLDIVGSVYVEDGRPILQLSIRDITDRKKILRLEAQTADLIAERQELLDINTAKDEFISVASHQLRTPATAVKQYVGIMLDGYVGRLTRAQRHTLERAFGSNERQIKIINDLLLVARVDAGKIVLSKEPTDMVRMVRDVAAEQQPTLERREQSLSLTLPRALKANVDCRFIRMVIENLLSNASKYSPEHSPVSIAVQRDRKYCYIDVIDRGFGISEADQAKLYRKFSRIYNERATSVEGTGLGLYWSKKIIELHDGNLLLHSSLENGSTFTIRLPIK